MTLEIEGSQDDPKVEPQDSDTGADGDQQADQGAAKVPDKVEEETTTPDEGKSVKEEPKRPSLSDFEVDEILNDERVREQLAKQVQSAKDKELARERRRQDEERSRRDATEAERRREEERRRYVEERDFEGLYTYDEESNKQASQVLEWADRFTQAEVGRARAAYDPILGEDVVERIYQEARIQPDATAFTFANRLAEEHRKVEVANAAAEARKSLPTLVAEEVEAKLVELGLKTRQEKVERGEIPSKTIADGKGKAAEEDTTYEMASEAYGRGEMPWEEFKPFKDEHDRKRRL